MLLTVDVPGEILENDLDMAKQTKEIAKNIALELQSILEKCNSLVDDQGNIDSITLKGKINIENIVIEYTINGKNEKIQTTKSELFNM